MNTQRRVQLGAAAVIANGLLVLGMASPALAAVCQPAVVVCGFCPSVIGCQVMLPPGCTTATDVQCYSPALFFCVNAPAEAICFYE